MSPPPRALEAVLLAAGAGTRLGGPKALLELQGRWTLPHVAAALLEGGARRVHVVLRSSEVPEIARRGLPAGCVPHVNPAPERGRGSSLACGLAAVPEGCAVLVHPCDVPLLQAEDVQKLREAWLATPAPDGWLARPVTRGGRGGHPLLLGADCVAEARRLGDSRSLRELVHAQPGRRLDVFCAGPGPFLGVDLPEQKEWLESLLAAPPHSGSHQR